MSRPNPFSKDLKADSTLVLGPAGVRSLCNGCGLAAARRSRDRESKGTL